MTIQNLPKTDRYPVLFLGHGSPMNAIEENGFVKGFRNIATDIPEPSVVLCISAHWSTRGTYVTAMEKPRTIHDFSGFPKELYEVQYPTAGSPVLASEVQSLLNHIEVGANSDWGLDHGSWSVLKHLFPNADIPVVQLSIDYTKSALYHFQLAQNLSSLREKGVLIIGSGNIIHNLNLLDFAKLQLKNYGYDWAIEVKEKTNQYIIDGNFNELIYYEKHSKAFQLAIPTAEHYIPMIYTLGLKHNNEAFIFFNDELIGGSLSMTSFKIG